MRPGALCRSAHGLESSTAELHIVSVAELLTMLTYMPGQEPLLLYECAYEALHFMRSPCDHARTLGTVRRRLHRQLVGAALLQARTR